MGALFSWFLPPWLAFSLAAGIQAGLILGVIAVGAMVFIWAERKVSGRIQDRLGPTRVGGKYGWLQSLADGIKLITKEDLMPAAADPLLFRMAPYVSVVAAYLAFLPLPFSQSWAGQSLDVGVFFVLAALGLQVFGVIMAGYASGSKWSLFGAMREAAQVVSYEVPLGLCVVVPVMLAGTMNLHQIGNLQAGWFWNWYVFHDPFTFIVFFVFATCATASVNRAPFDLAEAESELVAGFHTEYSGIRWSYFFLAEYGSMILISGFGAVLFCGGWNGPVPIGTWLGLTGDGLAGYLGEIIGTVNMLFKASIGVLIMMWVRWSLPRLRIDQVMQVCLKYCLPIACVMMLGAACWQIILPGGIIPHRADAERRFRLAPGAPPVAVHLPTTPVVLAVQPPVPSTPLPVGD